MNVVELLPLMLHVKIKNHWPSGSGEEDLSRFLLFIAMVAIISWSCIIDHLYKLLFLHPRDTTYKIWL